MLNDEDWTRIRAYTDQVASRDTSEILFLGGRVNREPDHSIVIRLDAMQVDLEPAGFMEVGDIPE